MLFNEIMCFYIILQCQATIVAFLASVFAIVVDVIDEHKFDVHHATLLCASSLITAAIASLVLGMVSFINIINNIYLYELIITNFR